MLFRDIGCTGAFACFGVPERRGTNKAGSRRQTFGHDVFLRFAAALLDSVVPYWDHWDVILDTDSFEKTFLFFLAVGYTCTLFGVRVVERMTSFGAKSLAWRAEYGRRLAY